MLAVAVAIAVVAAGCGDDKKAASSDTATTVKSSEPIIIGMPAERTGPTATPSSMGADGVKLAVDTINAAGGVDGRKFKLMELDNGGDAATAVQQIQQMKQAGAVAFVGPVAGSLCAATGPTYQKLAVPALCLSPADLPPGSDTFFGIGAALAQVDFASLEYLGKTDPKVGVIVPQSPVGQLFRKHAAASTPKGVTLTMQDIAPTDTTAKPQIQNLMEAGVGSIFIAHCGSLSLTAAHEAVDLGFKGKIFLYNCFASNGAAQAIKGFTNGNIETLAPKFILGGVTSSDPQKKAIDAYAKAGGKPEIVEADGWDGVHVLADAIRNAGSSDPAKVIAALENNLKYDGVWSAGTITAKDHRGVTTDGALIPATFTKGGELVRSSGG